MRWLADVAYLVAGLIYLPVALYHALIVGKNRRGWRQRLGFVPVFEPGRRRIWIHAVSLGEINATPRLVEMLGERLPDAEIVFSTTTDTGFARAVQLYGAERVFRFPFDFSLVIARVLKRVQPSMIVLVELEVWYNLVRMATRRGVPVVVVNGRLTARSARRLERTGRFGRLMFSDLVWVGAQDEEIASRFRSLGVPGNRIEVTSSLKWDSAEVTDQVEGADVLARALGIDLSHPLWVCGSTGPGEETMILDAYRQLLRDWPVVARTVQAEPVKTHGCHAQAKTAAAGARILSRTAGNAESPLLDGRGSDRTVPGLVIVPRKPERFGEVARLIERAGFACIRRSAHGDGNPVGRRPERAVWLGDTMGELRKFYSLADVVFVGRTLVPLGGSDPMEVAAMGKPAVIGPYTDNFELPVRALCAADAIRRVESAKALPSMIASILSDRKLAEAIGARARRVVLRHQGATQRTADAIIRLLDSGRLKSSNPTEPPVCVRRTGRRP